MRSRRLAVRSIWIVGFVLLGWAAIGAAPPGPTLFSVPELEKV
jgi:hypothetical protein